MKLPFQIDLNGKVAVITGASSGLGKQMSYALAKQGASLVLLARRIDKLNEIKNGKQFKIKSTKISNS